MVTCFCHSPLHEYLPSCDTAGHIPRKLTPNAGNCRNSFSFMFVSRNNIYVQGHDNKKTAYYTLCLNFKIIETNQIIINKLMSH